MEASEIITIEKPGPPAIVAELAPLVQQARAFEVLDQESDRLALERVRALRLGERAIEAHFKDAVQAAHQAHRKMVASVAALTGPIAEARSIYDRKAQAYETEERLKAQAEQRRLQEQARRQEEDRVLLEAIEAEQEGDSKAAEAILDRPVEAPLVTVAPAVAKVAGISSRALWSAEVHDVVECLLFMTRREEWRAALERLRPELEAIFRPLAVAQREAMSIPGVRAVSRESRATRS